MLKAVESVFPDSVDPLIYFQDANLNRQAIMEAYDAYIAEQQYDTANAYIDDQDEMYGYWADFFNAIENRIYATQDAMVKTYSADYVLGGVADDEECALTDSDGNYLLITKITKYYIESFITDYTSYDDEPTISAMTYEEMSAYTHARLAFILYNALGLNKYIWISASDSSDGTEAYTHEELAAYLQSYLADYQQYDLEYGGLE